MKLLLHLLTLLALATSLHAHGRFLFSPSGGRILAIDSTTTPNAEVKLTPDHRFAITFLDHDRKPIPLGDRKLIVTAGDRSASKKLSLEPKGDTLLTEPAPPGTDYFVIMQLREPGAAKSLPIRLHYDTAVCSECKQPEWLCDCGSKNSGKNIAVPDTLESLWAEINQHTAELQQGTADKAYEAIDEVTEAFPVLITALPGKTDAAQQPAATKLVAELNTSVTAVRETFAARKPTEATPHLQNITTTLTQLKALYPPAVANAKLKE